MQSSSGNYIEFSRNNQSTTKSGKTYLKMIISFYNTFSFNRHFHNPLIDQKTWGSLAPPSVPISNLTSKFWAIFYSLKQWQVLFKTTCGMVCCTVAQWSLVSSKWNFYHWIKKNPKSKSSMVASGTPYLTTDTFLDVVVKKIFPLLSLGWYLFPVVNGNVSVASWIISLVTIPFLDFVIIHWIQWRSFRKNPNEVPKKGPSSWLSDNQFSNISIKELKDNLSYLPKAFCIWIDQFFYLVGINSFFFSSVFFITTISKHYGHFNFTKSNSKTNSF